MNPYKSTRTEELENLLIAILLSQPSHSIKVIGVNLDIANKNRFYIETKRNLQTNDFIISIYDRGNMS